MIQFKIPPGKAAIIILVLLNSIERSYQFQRYDNDDRRVRLYRNMPTNDNMQEIPANDKGRAAEQLYDRRSFRTGTDPLDRRHPFADNTRSTEMERSNGIRERMFSVKEEHNGREFSRERTRANSRVRNIINRDLSPSEKLDRDVRVQASRQKVEVDHLTRENPNLIHRISSRNARDERDIRLQPSSNRVEVNLDRRYQSRNGLNMPVSREMHENRDRRITSRMEREERIGSTEASRKKVEDVRQSSIHRVHNLLGGPENRMRKIEIRDSLTLQRRQRDMNAYFSRERDGIDTIQNKRQRDSTRSETSQSNNRIRDSRREGNIRENLVFPTRRIEQQSRDNSIVNRRHSIEAAVLSNVNLNHGRIITRREFDQSRKEPNYAIREVSRLSHVGTVVAHRSYDPDPSRNRILNTVRYQKSQHERNSDRVQVIREEVDRRYTRDPENRRYRTLKFNASRSRDRRALTTRNSIESIINNLSKSRENIDFSESNDRRQGRSSREIRNRSDVRKKYYIPDHVLENENRLNIRTSYVRTKINADKSYIENVPGEKCSSSLEQGTTKRILNARNIIGNDIQYSASRIKDDRYLISMETLGNRRSRYAFPGSDSTRQNKHNFKITLSNYDMDRYLQRSKAYEMTNSSSGIFMDSIKNIRNLQGKTMGNTLTNTPRFDDITLEKDSNLWINTIQIILGAYLLAQMFANSSKKNKIRYSAMESFVHGKVKGKVQ